VRAKPSVMMSASIPLGWVLGKRGALVWLQVPAIGAVKGARIIFDGRGIGVESGAAFFHRAKCRRGGGGYQ